jgi:hypothetical protein
MQESLKDLKARMIREAFEAVMYDPPLPPPPPPQWTSVHFSELKENRSSDPTAEGWNVYVREVARLIAEGNEGKWVVIAEGRLIGVYDTKGEGYDAIDEGKFTWPSILKQIRVHEQLRPAPIRCRRCRN